LRLETSSTVLCFRCPHKIAATKGASQWPFVSQSPYHPNDLPVVAEDRSGTKMAVQKIKKASYRNV